MRSDGRDNTKKLWNFISIVVLPKNKKENKTYLNGYSDFEESLFWGDSKGMRSNNDSKSYYNDKSK